MLFMKLNEYIKTKRGIAGKLAFKLNAHSPDIFRWADGTRPIPLKYGYAIEQATDGHVTRKDLFPNEWEKIWPELINK